MSELFGVTLYTTALERSDKTRHYVRRIFFQLQKIIHQVPSFCHFNLNKLYEFKPNALPLVSPSARKAISNLSGSIPFLLTTVIKLFKNGNIDLFFFLYISSLFDYLILWLLIHHKFLLTYFLKVLSNIT